MKKTICSKKALEYLAQKDKKLGEFIAKRGKLSFAPFGSLFYTLVCSIIDQQVATSAAEAIKGRVTKLFGEIAPENFKKATIEQLRSCGMSARKAEYILGITKLANSGQLEYEQLNKLSDEEIAKTLLKIRGVGNWTVEMLLMFCFCRPDVTSYGDLAIRRGVMNIYGMKELTEEKFKKLAKRWSPYGTLASLYLWEAAVNRELLERRGKKSASRKGTNLMRG